MHGVFASDSRPEDQVFWFHRVFPDLPVADPAAKNYTDIVQGARDKEAEVLLAKLVDQLRSYLPESNCCEYTLQWVAGHGVCITDPTHAKWARDVPLTRANPS